MKRAVILLGVTALVGQVLMLRELAVALRGNELVFGVTLAAWLVLTAAGSGVLGRLADVIRSPREVFVIGMAAAGVLVPLSVIAVRVWGEALFGPVELIAPLARVLLGAAAALAPLCLTLGFLFAAACRLFARGDHGAEGVTWVYIFEAIGTVAGGVVFTHVAAGRFGNLHVACALASLDCFAAFALWVHGERGRALGGAFAVAALVLLGALVTPVAGVMDMATQRVRYPGEMLRWSADSRYGHVDVTAQGGQRNFYYDRVPIGSTHDDEAVEPLAYLPLLAHPRPSRVMVIGGAGTALLRKLLEDRRVTVHLVELDPALLRAAAIFGEPDDRRAMGDRARVLLVGDVDGRRWIKARRAEYDVVICCLPDPSTVVVNRFYTVEFFAEVRRALKPGGILATQLESSPSQMSRPLQVLTATHLRTLRHVFPHVTFAALDRVNVFLASDGPLEALGRPQVMADRAGERGLRPQMLVGGVLADALRADRRERVLSQVIQAGAGRLNTDLWPVSTVFALWHWGSVEGGRWAAALRWAMGLRLQQVILGAAFLGALLLAGACLSTRPVALVAPATLAAVGGGALVLEMTVIFAFQGLYGYAYEQVGMIFAAFMVGLAGGGFLSGRGSPHARPGALALVQLVMALTAGAAPMLYRHFAAEGLAGVGESVGLAGLNLWVGGVTGFQFPLVAAIVVKKGSRAAGRGGLIYALDLAGSCLGALLAGGLLVPVFGLANTCYVVGGVLAVSAGALLVAMGLDEERGLEGAGPQEAAGPPPAQDARSSEADGEDRPDDAPA